MDFLIDHLKLCAALGRLMPKGLDMKKIYLFVVGVLVSTVAFASEPGDGSKSGLAVVKKNETTFNLFYQPVGFADVKVSILNAKGEVIFTELVKETDGFVRPYNFSDLNEGEYAIKINDGDNQLTEKLL